MWRLCSRTDQHWSTRAAATVRSTYVLTAVNALRRPGHAVIAPLPYNMYSIWLEPSGACAHTLQREIHLQAQEHGVAAFVPHVTLLGGIGRTREETLAIASDVANELKPLRVNFLDVSTGDKFHQCVYILCANDPHLQAAHLAARIAFEMPSDQPYMPHLSLLYADVDAAARSSAAKRAVQRLHGEGSNYETLLHDSGFGVSALSVWHTLAEDKSLATWCKVADIPFPPT